jgi:hypothetical protein
MARGADLRDDERRTDTSGPPSGADPSVREHELALAPDSDRAAQLRPEHRRRWRRGGQAMSPMEDILASIRRVLSEDKAPAGLGRKRPDPEPLSRPASLTAAPSDERIGTPTAAHDQAEATTDLDEVWVWEERQRLFDQVAHLEHKNRVLAGVAAICASTVLGVLAGVLLGIAAGIAVYLVSSVVAVAGFRFACNRGASGLPNRRGT